MMPNKTDINPATNKAYAVNPESGVWDDNYWANTVEPQLKTQYGTSSTSAAIPTFTQPTIDLPKLYQGLYASSGISDTERQLVDTQSKANATIAGIKDNPYLSEGNMTGRISKVTDKSNADIANLKNDIAMRKADVETQLNLKSKQFDIDSQKAKAAFDQFTTLLSAGALDNASGEDIANLTRSTGLSSSMIQSAIGVSKNKNAPKVNTSVIQTDDGTTRYAVVINSDTGAVINKQTIGASTPTAAEVKAGLGGSGSGTSGKAPTAQQLQGDASKAAQSGKTYQDMLKFFTAQGLTALQVYKIYTAANYYGRPPDGVDPKTGLYKKK